MENLTIDINGMCNIGCEFCYQNLDGSVLSQEQILKIVKENPNFDTVEIGGGEPFLYKGFVELIRKIRENGKKIHIATNATIIPPNMLGLEDRVRDDITIQVSLHASHSDLYQEITGKNLFGKVINNTKKIKPFYQTVISSAIYKKNFDDVPNLINLAEGMGLPIRINLVFPVGSGKNVELLNQKEIDYLRGYLLAQNLQRGKWIDSPLMHINNCGAFEMHYGIQKRGPCPVDCKIKRYISPRNEHFDCEFLQGGKHDNEYKK